MVNRGGGSSFTLVRQICQTCTTFDFQLSILIYSLMIIGPAAAWSAWPVTPPLVKDFTIEIFYQMAEPTHEYYQQ